MHILIFLALFQFSGAGSFVPGQGGLNGWAKNTPAISAASCSPSATTLACQWTTNIGSDSRTSCVAGAVTEQANDNGVQSNVTAHQNIVAALIPSTAYVCTLVSGNTSTTVSATTNALAATIPITGISLGTATQYNLASPPHTMDGDTFSNFQSNDGITYVSTNDTVTGWNGNSVNAAMMLAKFTSLSPITGADVNTLSGYGPCCTPQGPLGLSPKINSIIGMGGQLFLMFTNQLENSSPGNPQFFGSIITSPDHGATWNNMQAPTTLTTTGNVMTPYSKTLFSGNTPSSFASCNFAIYGADDGTMGYLVAANRFDNGDAFVYCVSNNTGGAGATWTDGDSYYLARMSRAKMANLHANWQFYVSGDMTLDSAWSSNQASATAILTNTGKLGSARIQYIPALNRYIASTFYYPSGTGTSSSTVMLFYDVSHLTSWTLIGTVTFPTTGCYDAVPLQVDALTATLSPTTMRVLYSCNFNTGAGGIYNLFYATMTVTH